MDNGLNTGRKMSVDQGLTGQTEPNAISLICKGPGVHVASSCTKTHVLLM